MIPWAEIEKRIAGVIATARRRYPHIADDVAQDARLAAWERSRELPEQDAWKVYGIAKWAIATSVQPRYRWQAVQPTFEDFSAVEIPVACHEDILPAHLRTDAELLLACVSQGGHAAAEAQGVSYRTLRRRRTEARQRLAEHVGEVAL